MPSLICGDKLPPRARAEVLEAFGFRWTVENEERARKWHAALKLNSRRVYSDAPTQTDSEWLAEHAFRVNKDGSLTRTRGGRLLALPAEAE